MSAGQSWSRMRASMVDRLLFWLGDSPMCDVSLLAVSAAWVFVGTGLSANRMIAAQMNTNVASHANARSS